MILIGTTHRFGDDIDTDAIIAARYLNTFDPQELAQYCMQDIDPNFVKRVHPGDILIAGKNFGCGSSREHAPIALKALGIACVIASSFARIFYRNSINVGFPILECPAAAAALRDGCHIQIDLNNGVITDMDTGEIYQSGGFPEFIQNIITNDGLMNTVAKKQNER